MGKKPKKTHWVIFGFFPDRTAESISSILI